MQDQTLEDSIDELENLNSELYRKLRHIATKNYRYGRQVEDDVLDFKQYLLALVKTEVEKATRTRDRQIEALEKRHKQSNRNARIDEQMRTDMSALSTFIVVKADDGSYVSQEERIKELKKGKSNE